MPISDWQTVTPASPLSKPLPIDDVLGDPGFQKQPFEWRLDLLRRNYPEFAELSPKDQRGLLAKTEQDAIDLGGTKVPDAWEEAAREWRDGHPAVDSGLSLLKYWEARVAFALVPPIVGYLLLFGVLPWIGRGFRSTHL